MTGAGASAASSRSSRRDPAGIARVVQGLLLHESWAAAYGVTLAEHDRDLVNLRRVDHVLDALAGRDDRPLDVPWPPPADRDHLPRSPVLAVALLRNRGVPARARCGFGAYFTPGWYEDHWVAEYHERPWKLLDAQIDDLSARTSASSSTSRTCRVTSSSRRRRVDDDAGRAREPGQVRAHLDPRGGCVVDRRQPDAGRRRPGRRRGAAVGPVGCDAGAGGRRRRRALFDELAAATAGPSMPDVRRLLADERLRVPDEVFNVQHRRTEPI